MTRWVRQDGDEDGCIVTCYCKANEEKSKISACVGNKML